MSLGAPATITNASQPIWYVYLVSCADASLYCGITTHVERRLAQHNGELPGGARCTRARRPVRLAACVACADRSTALRLEARVKKTPRGEKVGVLLAGGEVYPFSEGVGIMPGSRSSKAV